MTKRMFIMLGCVLILIIALALGKFLQIRQLIANSPQPGAETVSTTIAQMQDWQPQINAVGSLTPVRGVEVASQISGMVESLHFKSGQDVKAGEVLLQIDAATDIAQLRALEAAAELAASVLERDRQQFEIEAISKAQLDGDVADLKAKQANVAQQKAALAKKTIRAPFAGRLGITSVNPGQYLNPGDKIVTLQTISPIYIDFNLPQLQLSQIAVGQTVSLESDAFAGQEFTGKISAINPKIDTATRNVLIQAIINNDKELLRPGMFANVKITSGAPKTYLTLPQTAITYNPYGSTIFVVEAQSKDKKDDGAASQTPSSGDEPLVAKQVFVTTGPTRGDQVAILTGLQAGQQVVTSGQIKLKNDTPVTINNTVQPANAAQTAPQEE